MREEPGPDGAREQRVRRLLAAARHDQPVPDDVAARIDAALAEAAREERTEPDPTADNPADNIVDLAARRRRRWSIGLAAAAVVVVAGVGLGASGLLDGDGGGGDGDESASSAQDAPSADSEESGPAPDPSESDEGDAGGADPRGPEGDQGGGDDGGGFTSESAPDGEPRTARGAPVVRDGARLVADLTAALRSRDTLDSAGGPRCAPPFLPGTVVRVRYDGADADVVAGPSAGGERRVEIYSCRGGADDAPVRAATVPSD